jgi:hypothetical protein
MERKIIKFKKPAKAIRFKVIMLRIKEDLYKQLEKQAAIYHMDIDTYASIMLNFGAEDIEKMIKEELKK